jgi:hypothetical protein
MYVCTTVLDILGSSGVYTYFVRGNKQPSDGWDGRRKWPCCRPEHQRRPGRRDGRAERGHDWTE